MSGGGNETARRVIGRFSTVGMQMARGLLASRLGRRSGAPAMTRELDRTGLLVRRAARIPVGWRDEEVIFPLYENSLAHSFWRAQEFSLLRRHLPLLERPVLDFGCGDGSFAAVLFDKVDFGVDIDEDALAVAREFDIYVQLLKSDGRIIELPDRAVGSVFSNSVLEHVTNLNDAVAEISRVLRPGGTFILSVPVARFARDLARYFGKAESERVNSDYFHRNLLETEDWQRLLRAHGLVPMTVQEYQPAWFSFYYMQLRYLGNQGLGRVFPGIRGWFWRRYRGRLVEKVRQSTASTQEPGGNVFIVARKESG